ncbi:hypothetical protein ACFPIJ_25675 [Dactylosporangium cerinum]|uniref:Uncharacterized protein n=1 Tax=Dactylosporangium cerinum TaxID=1434730 RepID=A0ABV9VXT9_9ACTN
MILAFSLGLAAVLVALGLILVRARTTLHRFRGRPLRWLPVVSAAVVAGLGLMMAATGMAHLTQ